MTQQLEVPVDQNFAQHLRIFLKDFCENSSIHGLKYLRTASTLLERLYWSIVVVLFFGGSCWITTLLWNHYAELPSRVIIKETQASILNVSYPSITICDGRVINTKKANDFAEGLKYPNADSKNTFLKSLKFLNGFIDKIEYMNITTLKVLKKLFEVNRLKTRDVMKAIGTSCEDLLTVCRWERKLYPCKDLFVDALTLRGFCCTLRFRFYPKQVYPSASGELMGLSLIYNPPEDSHGYIYIEESDEVLAYISPLELLHGEELFLGMEPYVQTCEKCASYSRIERTCIFPHEKHLKYYSPYTQYNCISECRLNRTLAICGCAPYFYQVPDDLICDVSQIPCLVRYHDFTTNYRENSDNLLDYSEQALQILKSKKISALCDCPIDCESVINRLVVTQQLDMDATEYDVSGFYENLEDREVQSVIHIYYSSEICMIWENTVIATWIDLMGSMGGVFAVFLGFSFVSLVELIYFFYTRVLSHYVSLTNTLDKMRNVSKTIKQKLRPSPMNADTGPNNPRIIRVAEKPVAFELRIYKLRAASNEEVIILGRRK